VSGGLPVSEGAGDVRSAVLRAARVLAAEGLVDAFGHVSARLDPTTYVITPPRPLGTLGSAGDLVVVPVGSTPPAAAPREAWLHTMAYRRGKDVRAVVRAQPPSALAAGALPGAWRPAHGHGALLGPAMPVHDDPRLARDQDTADAIITTLGTGRAVVLRGNGALTVAPEGVGEAVAAMWVVEAAARIRLALAAAPEATVFTAAEAQAWQCAAPELLGRIWSYLAGRHARRPLDAGEEVYTVSGVTGQAAAGPVDLGRLLAHDYWLILSTPAAGTDTAAIDGYVADHVAWLLALERDGIVLLSGPLLSGPGVGPGSGVTVVRAADEEAARLIAADDPFVRARLRTFEVYRWRVNEGSVSVRMSLGTGTYEWQ
jgi:ribulose-5-phosphate 4-epimerase/fuculose-1-phosphate aldolase/uncharacterized protein YciI